MTDDFEPQSVCTLMIGTLATVDLVELTQLDPSLKLDIRYARCDNFLGYPVYTQARAFLQRPVAEAVVRVHRALAIEGLGLQIFDGYRPWSVTRTFWQAVAPSQRAFVADPARGSRHNRGCAVDLTLFDRTTGQALEMPSDFDEMTERAHIAYPGGSEEARRNRDRLQSAMAQEGFTVYAREWWHYDHPLWTRYPILDLSFEQLALDQDLPPAEPVEPCG
ncbi:M15 family metallopeptidase [Thermostichus vulcanus]|uniref:D-alanyl-D-alanine dipeptidase n=1 Tax=Thermostichus vulcanus str. 'Rupite' TaxID=2813851 RepID=A0ABT0C8Q6_THEVL|nr:M15 family metallopeptidase [Thermostichus vulcanus]MCJ2542178.1 M15 family metallopeptidase [Thermostichus vulcanus str. 'Rupite']